ncbi:MAG TPA: response regulator [Gemmatimonadales bacterium]|jgi:CheY-like chemotaxis protein|nr:response regulator [Gemmatimonadales bacterium]
MTSAPSGAAIEVLLVEDNADDSALTIRALQRSKLRNRVHLAVTGVEALAMLRREGRFADAPRPDLILLDLNLPGMDGRELLAQIKGDDRLRHIPVVVVTGSRAEEDVVRSYQLHANAYVTKPINTKEFIDAVNSIEQFWLQIVRLR